MKKRTMGLDLWCNWSHQSVGEEGVVIFRPALRTHGTRCVWLRWTHKVSCQQWWFNLVAMEENEWMEPQESGELVREQQEILFYF